MVHGLRRHILRGGCEGQVQGAEGAEGTECVENAESRAARLLCLYLELQLPLQLFALLRPLLLHL